MEPGVSGKDYTDARVAEVKSDLRADIVTLESRIINRLDKMPTLWQLISAVGAGVLATLAILAYASDRSDSSAERASAITASLSRLEAAAVSAAAQSQGNSGGTQKSSDHPKGK